MVSCFDMSRKVTSKLYDMFLLLDHRKADLAKYTVRLD